MGFEPGNNLGQKFSSENQPEKNGRPKKLPPLDLLMEKVLGEEKDGITAMEAIIMKLRQQAAGGNIKASEILLDRAFGKSKQSLELSGMIATKQIVGIVIKKKDDPS